LRKNGDTGPRAKYAEITANTMKEKTKKRDRWGTKKERGGDRVKKPWKRKKGGKGGDRGGMNTQAGLGPHKNNAMSGGEEKTGGQKRGGRGGERCGQNSLER